MNKHDYQKHEGEDWVDVTAHVSLDVNNAVIFCTCGAGWSVSEEEKDCPGCGLTYRLRYSVEALITA